jgi:hypothetical protein
LKIKTVSNETIHILSGGKDKQTTLFLRLLIRIKTENIMAYTIAFFGTKPYDEASFNDKNKEFFF